MRKNNNQGNVYMGFKLNEHWGVEVWRESTFTKVKQVTLKEGEVINGMPLPDDLSPATFLTSLKTKGPHASIVFSHAIFNPMPINFVGSLGLSHVTIRAFRDNISFGKGQLPGTSRLMKKSTLVLRPMAGLQYNFENGLSLRASFSWLNTSGKRIQSKDSDSLRMRNKPSVYLKDSFVSGVGFLVNI
jgi:hypothetical protein